MLYSYELIEVRKNVNKKKIIFLILIILIIIALSVFGAIKLVEYNKQKELDVKIEQENLQEQKRIEEERIKEEKRLKNSKEFTEEQKQSIENIYHNSNEKRVFLTFDDGPTKSVTPFILDLLKQENIKATFFVLGNKAKSNSDLIKREFEEGHYIANHGYTHKYSQIYQNPQTVLDEYNYTEQCIQEALENPDYHSRIFRFPGGSTGGYYSTIKRQTKQFLRENGIVSLDWNALSKDAEGANTKEQILENIKNTIGNKQSVVILMHDSSDKILTYETLPDVIQYLRENNYEFKNIYDIL
ncbi:MAG: polysaccharide deacetylase [Clostridiaceae bacterium]|nr:polysaccharide deacetylase [Clostridiaceae bacterium]